MPRTGPRRPQVALRLGEAGINWVDTEAERRGINRSEMIRLALVYAAQTMPKTWKPKA